MIIFFLYAACELSQVSAFAEEMKQYGLVTCSVQQTAQTVGLHYSTQKKRSTYHNEGRPVNGLLVVVLPVIGMVRSHMHVVHMLPTSVIAQRHELRPGLIRQGSERRSRQSIVRRSWLLVSQPALTYICKNESHTFLAWQTDCKRA